MLKVAARRRRTRGRLRLAVRLGRLERWSHKPFDFTRLIERLDKLEREVALLLKARG